MKFTTSNVDIARNRRRLLLAFFWYAGFLSGIFCYEAAGSATFSLMRRIPYGSVSIVSDLLTVVLPFLVCAYAVGFLQTQFLFPIGFVTAFLLSFVSYGLIIAYASAGWLICGIALFGRMSNSVLLYLMCLRALSDVSAAGFWLWLGIICVVILIESIHYSIISPFLAGLIII